MNGILPENLTCRNLHWRLIGAAGIDSPLGSLEIASDGLFAVVLPKANGEVYIRCGVKNGLSHIALHTAYPIRIEGFGQRFLDPYGFISGGLYSHSNVTLTNGNERGVATRHQRVNTVPALRARTQLSTATAALPSGVRAGLNVDSI